VCVCVRFQVEGGGGVPSNSCAHKNITPLFLSQLASTDGTAAATELANALIQHECVRKGESVWGGELGAACVCYVPYPPPSLSPAPRSSLPALPLGPLDDLPRLRASMAVALISSAAAALTALQSAAAAAAAAAAAMASAAASLTDAPPPPLPTPVFACLGLPALAGCLQRAAGALAEDAEGRRRVVAALAALTPPPPPAPTPRKRGRPVGVALRNQLTVCVLAWRGAPASGGGAVAAEIEAVAAEMVGF